MDTMRSYELEWNRTGTGGGNPSPPVCLGTLETLSNQGWGVHDLAYFNAASSFSVTSEVEEMLAELDDIGISVPNPKAIRDYLTSHPDVTGFISRVSRHVWSQLSIRSQLSLELYIDREIDDQYPTLYVRQDTYDEQILDNIDKAFDPFMDELAALNGWFLVTTDFRPPRRES